MEEAATPRTISLKELSDEPRYQETFYQQIAASEVLARASSTVRFALEKIYFDGEPRVRVAAQLGIDRFALNRQLLAFSDSFKEVRICA
jgi:hypothetical protein